MINKDFKIHHFIANLSPTSLGAWKDSTLSKSCHINCHEYQNYYIWSAILKSNDFRPKSANTYKILLSK